MRATKAPVPATLDSSIIGLQRGVGNRAVAGLLSPSTRMVQRHIGWTKDVVTDGEAWNAGERQVGKIRRIPLEGLPVGLQQESATKWVKNKTTGAWEPKPESTKIKELSPESAVGRAIVLVPEALDGTQKIDVLVVLHGHTEGTHRPYAGWRTLPTLPADRPKGKPDVEALRQGRDAKDVAPVRDVALDQAAQQLEESGYAQTVIVLPQGGLHSQFGKAGDYSFESGTYVDEIVKRLFAEGVWKDAQKAVLKKKAPDVRRVSMAGHSGAGSTLTKMAQQQSGSSALTGDLVLFDAINEGQTEDFKNWALRRLQADLAVLTGPKTDPEKYDYLRTAQKLRVYYSPGGGYQTRSRQLEQALNDWFTKNASKLGKFEAALRANFVVKPSGVQHEELMRGVGAGQARGKGVGGILDALKGLNP